MGGSTICYISLASAENKLGASVCTLGPPSCCGPNTELSVAGLIENFEASWTMTATNADWSFSE